MSMILDGWDYDNAVEYARTRGPAERKRLMRNADALRDLQHAVRRIDLLGLCLYCGSIKTPVLPGGSPQCFCMADE